MSRSVLPFRFFALLGREVRACLVVGLLGSLVAACGASSSPTQSPNAVAASAPERASLDASKIVFAMRGHERDFRVCFFQAPNTRGTVRVAFDVDESGVVEEARLVDSTIQRDGVESCLLARTKDLRFGNQRKPGRGLWTFVFRLVEPMADEDKAALAKKKQAAAKKDAHAEEDEPAVVVEGGGLDERQIAETVEVGFPLFARCYRDALNRRDRMGGSVRFRFSIDESGKIAKLDDLGSEMPDPLAVDCIAEGFYAMNFPAPTDAPVSAVYRLELD
jgi:hypothetical protein